MCQLSFSLAGELAPYVVQLLDAHGHATATRNDPLNPPANVSFILTNKFDNATVSFVNPARGKAVRIVLDVLPRYGLSEGTSGIPLSPDRYTRPIQVNDSDKTGATKLSSAVVTSPSDVVTLWYDGKSYVSPSISVRPNPGRLWTTFQRLIPILATREFRVPNARPMLTDSGSGRLLANGDGTYSFLASNAVDTVSSEGRVTVRALPGWPVDLAKGPDGLTWSLDIVDGKPVLTRLDGDGSLSQFPIDGDSAEPVLVEGSDRHLWMVVEKGTNCLAVRVDTGGNAAYFRVGKSQTCPGPPASNGPGNAIWLRAAQHSLHVGIEKIDADGASRRYYVPTSTFPCCEPVLTNSAYSGGPWLYAAISGFLAKISQEGAFRPFPAPLDNDSAGPFTFLADGAIWYEGGDFASGSCNVIVGRATTEGASALMQMPSQCSAYGGLPYVPQAYALSSGNVLWYLRGNYVGEVRL